MEEREKRRREEGEEALGVVDVDGGFGRGRSKMGFLGVEGGGGDQCH